MSEENVVITHSRSTPYQQNPTATENKTMGTTGLEVILCTIEGELI